MDIGAYISENKSHLQEWGEHVAASVVSTHGSLLKVPAQVRVKDPNSARAKQLKKNYANPHREMTDLVGVRFVVLTSRELKPIREHITTTGGWEAIQARNPADEIQDAPAVFGYQSHHYEVRPASGSSRDHNLCCEVQVRTILQHAHAELSHETLYKSSQKIPSEAQRLVARSMALMEVTDEMLCNAVDAVRLANEPALSLQRTAERAVGALLGQTPQSIVDEVLMAFSDVIDRNASQSLRMFIDQNSRVPELLARRLGAGLFAFPELALITYWLTDVADEDLLDRWPLPGSRGDVEQILSDMGIGA